LYTQLLQRVINRSLDAELDAHLGYAKHEKGETARPNSRNGATKKTVKGKFGELEIRTPRDRAATFEPQLVKKRQTRLGDFEDKILALYARGMSGARQASCRLNYAAAAAFRAPRCFV
jgi:putative transposase